MNDLLLGIDIGTTGTKAALFTPDGQLRALGRAEYPLHILRPGWVEQQPEDWWQAACTAIRAALSGVESGAERVLGLAVSSQAPTLLPLDRSGQPLHPALIWMDRRAEAQVGELSAQFGHDTIYRITGNRPDAYYVASKLRWLHAHEPGIVDQTHRFVQANGYVNFRLTGEFSLDHAHAALLQLRHYATGEWWVELCEACGVRPDQFSPVQPGHHTLGAVTPAAAELTGLRVGTPVMVGTVDGSAAAVEAGAIAAGNAAEMTGTSTVLLMPNQTGVTEPALIALPHALPELHLLLGAMVASGASLRWFRDQFGAAEVATAAHTGADAFDLLTAQAAEVPAGSHGLIFLPYMMGERSPLWHSHARGVLFGLSLGSTRAAVIRAILEGSACALRHNVEVAQQAGLEVHDLRSVGGGARSAVWSQIKADVLGLPVLIPEASVGAPFGDAVLVGMGVGLYPDVTAALRQIIRFHRTFEPDSRAHAVYTEQYGLFRRLYAHLRDDFDHAATLQSSAGLDGEA